MKTTVFIYLDACRFDYITKSNSPFLFEMAQKGVCKKVRTTAGFTQRTPMLTGSYPSTSGHFTWYLYDPVNSPFRWVKPFGFAKELLAYNRFAKWTIRMLTKTMTGNVYPDPAYIPLDLLPYFDASINKFPLEKELGHLPNIFSVCKQKGLEYMNSMNTFSRVGSKNHDEFFNTVEKSLQAGKKYDLYLTHLGDLDVLGHKFGPGSRLVEETLYGIDCHIEEMCNLLSKNYESYRILVVSDHGMREVAKFVDVMAGLEEVELNVPRDYLYFLDATLARFWFKTERTKRDVVEKLLGMGCGHILSDEEEKKRHIYFHDNRYGELYFWLDKGYVICPSFFQKNRQGTKGMHGYLDDEQMLGAFLVYSSKEEIEGVECDVVELVDTFPTLLSLADIGQVPCEGSSVIRERCS